MPKLSIAMNKWKKLKKQSQRAQAISIVLLSIILSYLYFLWPTRHTYSGFTCVATSVVIVCLTIVFMFTRLRCPDCGQHPERNWHPRHCSQCGTKSDRAPTYHSYLRKWVFLSTTVAVMMVGLALLFFLASDEVFLWLRESLPVSDTIFTLIPGALLSMVAIGVIVVVGISEYARKNTCRKCGFELHRGKAAVFCASCGIQLAERPPSPKRVPREKAA